MASLEQINYQPHRAEISDGSLQWAPLKRKPIKNLPQIVWEDNSTWAEANLQALDQATSSKRDLKTVRSNMSHLLAYAKWLEAESIQWWHFPERESERCLVRFRGALVAARNNGDLAPTCPHQSHLYTILISLNPVYQDLALSIGGFSRFVAKK